jgi:hypothetical protein
VNLDQVTIEIRPRTAWEAVDLGIIMAKRWWWPMMKIWFIVSFPIFLISLLFPLDKLVWAGVLIWWFKPVYERPILFYLSHAVFNELPGLHTTLKNFPALAFKQLFLSLTWRRLSFSRGMDLPVLQLEGLTGTRRNERLSVLHREDSSPVGWLHVLGFFLEVFIAMGVMGIVWALVPKEINIDWANLFWDRESSISDYIFHVTGYLAMWLVAPFYVACGFSLYLNRRIKLEAWDLDIAFRRMVSKRQISQVTLSILFLFSVFFSIDAQRLVYAQEDPVYQSNVSADVPADVQIEPEVLGEPTNLNRDSAKKAVNELLQQDEFSNKEKVKRLRLKNPEKEDESTFIKWLLDLMEGSEDKAIGLGRVFELLLWMLVIGLIVLLIYRYRHWLSAQFVRVGPAPKLKEKPVTLFGMDVRKESLPDDVNAAALALMHAGDKRAALALLYRASLAHLIYTGVEIEDGFTELECLQTMKIDLQARNKTRDDQDYAASRIQYFSDLTLIWRRLAYGHLLPDERQAQKLCSNWNQCWLRQTASGAKS